MGSKVNKVLTDGSHSIQASELWIRRYGFLPDLSEDRSPGHSTAEEAFPACFGGFSPFLD